MNDHPLNCLHRSAGGLEAAADAYTAEFVAHLRNEVSEYRRAAARQIMRIEKLSDEATRLRTTCAEQKQEITRLRAENKALRADIARHIAICAEQAQEIERLLEFVKEVRRSGDTRLASMAIAVLARTGGVK